MTNPSLLYGNGAIVSPLLIEASSPVTSYWDAASGELSFSVSTGVASGQAIPGQTYELSTDFVPTISVPSTGTATTYALQSAALFWSISYTPVSSNSTIYLYLFIKALITSSTTQSSGIGAWLYQGTNAGTFPLSGNPALYSQGVLTSAVVCQGSAGGLGIFPNVQTAPITFSACAYALNSPTSPRILSSTSTATVFGGYCASTITLIEVPN